MPLDLPTAQAELDEARALLATLQEQVRDGDEDVTAQQLADQRELISFAELRAEAAQRTETRVREDERAAVAAKAKAAAAQLIAGAGMTAIANAERDAVNAITRLVSLAHARNARIAEVGTALVSLDEALEAAGVGKAPGNTHRYGVWGGREHVVVQGMGRVSVLDVGALTTAAVVAGLGIDPAGRDAQVKHMNTFHGLRDQVVRNLLEAYPEIGDVLRVTPDEYASADERGRYALTQQGRRPVPQEVQS